MAEKWLKYWRECFRRLRLIVVLWPIITAVFVLVNNFPEFHKESVYQSFLTCGIYAFFVPLIISLCYFVFFGFLTALSPTALPKFNKNIIFHIALSMPAMAFGLVIANWVESLILKTPFNIGGTFGESILLGALISLVFIFFYGYRNVKGDLVQWQQKSLEAEYLALKNQMQPHFLFNSLNSLSELMLLDTKAAATSTQKLADLYRRILMNSKLKTATLASEIEIIENYLDIESMRFGDRLIYKINCDIDPSKVFIPSLILQTLVENAIKHGISKSIRGGEINVFLSKTGPNLYGVRIVNTGALTAIHSLQGVGLKNTRERLELLYGSSHQFELSAVGAQQTEAKFYFSGANLG